MNDERKKPVFLMLFFLLLANCFSWIIVYELSKEEFLEVTFFDIGQGDAIFIETPDNYQILIDGGPDSSVLEKLAETMAFWDRSINMIVLTHPEHDHMAGLIEVLKRFDVDYVLWTGVKGETGEYQEWLSCLNEEKAHEIIAVAGKAVKSSELSFLILSPFEDLQGKEVSNKNNSSVVLHLLFKDNSFLFLGDVYQSAEKDIAKGKIKTNVLKIAHHGSKTSTSEDLLEKADPQLAVISAGRDNKYGHPHEEVLELLNKYDITVLRTDQLGDIKVTSDGKNINTIY